MTIRIPDLPCGSDKAFRGCVVGCALRQRFPAITALRAVFPRPRQDDLTARALMGASLTWLGLFLVNTEW
jgi:hypothetical protein